MPDDTDTGILKRPYILSIIGVDAKRSDQPERFAIQKFLERYSKEDEYIMRVNLN